LEKPIIPNTFTPNGDGVNDAWKIEYLDSYPNVAVNVFNRYGVRVFVSIGYREPWDGMYKGQAVPVGTYYYVIDPKIALPAFKGWVVVIR
jgi:gliding motility-associated-like protein